MRKSPRDVKDAILRATNAVVYNEEQSHPGITRKVRTNTDFDGGYEGDEIDGSCGALL
jgi:hypothetical protein